MLHNQDKWPQAQAHRVIPVLLRLQFPALKVRGGQGAPLLLRHQELKAQVPVVVLAQELDQTRGLARVQIRAQAKVVQRLVVWV